MSAPLPYITTAELVIGANDPLLREDIENRPLKEMLRSSGYDPIAAFGGLYGPVYNVLNYRSDWNVDIGDGINDADTPFQDCFDAAPTGSIVFIPQPSNFYKFSNQLTISKQLTVVSYRGLMKQTAQNTGGILVTADEVSLRGLYMVGPQFAVSHSAEKGLQIQAVDSAHPLLGIEVLGCRMEEWWSAIYGIYLQQFDWEHNRCRNCYHSGLFSQSSQFGRITRNRIRDVIADGNPATGCYGVAVSRPETDDLSTSPHQTDIVVSWNEAYNIPWEAFDTHGGRRITFSHNFGYNVGRLIAMVTGDGLVQDPQYASLDVLCDGNVGFGASDGTALQGIILDGAGATGVPVELGTGIISNNVLRGFGAQDNVNMGAIQLDFTKGVQVINNYLIEPSPIGVSLYHDNYDFLVDGLTVVDAWSTDAGFSAVISPRSGYNTGRIRRVKTLHGSKSATFVNELGLYVSSTTSTLVSETDNDFSICTTPYSGGQTVTLYGEPITVDGFNKDNVSGTVGDTELVRALGRFRPARAGCVVGIVISASEARTAGSLTVKVFKNTGLADAAGSQLSTESAALNGTDTSEKITRVLRGNMPFLAFDEIYATYTTTGWTPTTSDLRASLLVVYNNIETSLE